MKRPKGISAISIYYIGSAVILAPLLLLLTRKDIDLFSRAEILFVSPVLIVLSIGLWKMKNWARVSAALLTAVGLVGGVVSNALHGGFLAFGTWNLILSLVGGLAVFLLNLWILVYLMSSRTRRAFLSPSGDT